MKRSPRDTDHSVRRISRRALVLGGAQVGVIGLLGMRMRQMQIQDADQYRLLAEENRIKIQLLQPARGLIYDRNGVVIADNEQTHRIVVTREEVEDLDALVAQLRTLVTFDEAELERNLRQIRTQRPYVPQTLADRLTWEELARVAVNTPALPGVTTEVGMSRFYPMRGDFSHIVGYVGPVSDYDLSRIENPDPLLTTPDFQIGKVGVETKLEGSLRGAAGTNEVEINAGGRVMRELGRRDGTPGTDLQLTVDYRLQNYVQERLELAESASAVVIDVETGDLVAMGSAPDFDPNLFVRGISTADYRALTENPYRPLANKTVQGLYPPGSTFKMMTALAGLEAGLLSPGETIWCPGHMTLGRRRFHCWKRGGHGNTDLDKSLVQSCDVYYYDVAQRTGIDRIAEMCHRFGLGERHDLPMSAVTEGLIPTTRWKAVNRGEPWLPGDSLNASIGQGFVLASPLQLAVMTARLASGRAVAPRLVKSMGGVDTDTGPAPALDVSPTNLRLIQQAMFNVSNSSRGTARRSRIVADGMEMAGKTGTSQVRNITAAERARGVFRNEDLPWERRDHALFVCYAPFDNPKYAVSVVVEHGGGGSAAAAPVGRDILLYALYGELPPLDAYPSGQRDEIQARHDQLTLREPVGPPSSGRSRA